MIILLPKIPFHQAAGKILTGLLGILLRHQSESRHRQNV
jgi:hypothetical protein